MIKQPKTNNRSQLDICCSCVSSQLTFNTPNQKVPINNQTGIRGVNAKWFYLNLYSIALRDYKKNKTLNIQKSQTI